MWSFSFSKGILDSLPGNWLYEHYYYQLSKETKLKMSIAKQGIKQQIGKCPHCQKECSLPTLSRWHMDNCKSVIWFPYKISDTVNDILAKCPQGISNSIRSL